MSEVKFWLVGKPETKGSTKSFFDARSRRIVTVNDNPKTKAWARSVATIARASGVEIAERGAPVSLEVEFVLQRPKSHCGSGKNAGQLREAAPRAHTSRPDVDKLLRAVLDALTGVAYVDDSQVDTVSARKVYVDPGAPTGARIWVSRRKS